jgi:hypothetical protein
LTTDLIYGVVDPSIPDRSQMIYRVLLDSIEFVPVESGEEEDVEARPSRTAMRGAFTAGLCDVWDELPMPRVDDPRLRFWFTEAGWRRFGRAVCAKARADGHVVRVIRRKNPPASEVAYGDDWQLALRAPSRRDG